MNFAKKTIFIFALLLVLHSASAQTAFQPEMYFGFTGGAVASRIGFSPSVSQDFMLGATGGAMFRYISEKYFGIQAELNFSQIGWQEKGGIFSRRLNYVDMPFLTHIYFGKKARFFVNLGPEIAFLIGQSGTIPPAGSEQEEQIRNPQRAFDYGFAIGSGFSVPFHKNALQLEIRGYYGMNDIYSNMKSDYFARSNNIKAAVTLGYTFKYH